MKSRIILLLVAILAMALPADARRGPGSKVGVEFPELQYDFGTVATDSGPVSHVFEVHNVGASPVAIVSAVSGCGCTRPEFGKKPVMPGQKGTVKVTFLPEGQRGEISKVVKLRLRNSDGRSEQVSLRLRGVVVPKAK